MRLTNKVIIITGSTTGIGEAIARRCAAEGARVVVSSRRQANVEDAVAQLRGEGLEVAGVACHVGDAAQLHSLVKFTLDRYGQLDILVSNAAVNPAAGPIMDMAPSAIDKILDINGMCEATWAGVGLGVAPFIFLSPSVNSSFLHLKQHLLREN